MTDARSDKQERELQHMIDGLGSITWYTTTTDSNGIGFVPLPVTPHPQDELAWLKRRIREILWQP